jgi:MFS superfamily sulfate permease-like transporter
MAQYIFKSILTIFRVYAIYKPSKFFLTIGSIIFLLGFILGIRWLLLVYLIDDPNRTYLPSLILAATLLIIGFQTMALSFIGDLFSINRKLLEEIKFKLK